MDRDPQNQRPLGSLPKSRLSLGANGRFVGRKPTRNLFTGAEMRTKEVPSPALSPPVLSQMSQPSQPSRLAQAAQGAQPSQPAQIPRAIRSVRSVSGLRTSSAAGNSLGPGQAGHAEQAERTGIPRLSRTPSRTDLHERPSSVASSTGSIRSDSKLPRPSLAHSQIPRTQPKRPITMFDAWRMTEEAEELGRTSPSPAPRISIPRRGQDETRIQRLKSQSPLDFAKRPNGARRTSDSMRDDISFTSSVGRSAIPRPVRYGEDDIEEDDMDRKLKQFEKDEHRKSGFLGRDTGLFTRPNAGNKVAEAGKEPVQELVKKTSNGSLKENSSPARARTWGSKGRVNSEWMKRTLASPDKQLVSPDNNDNNKQPLQERNHNSVGKDSPLPSVEVHPPSTVLTSEPAFPGPPPEPESIHKGFHWELDADFTDADLQISNSPRVTFSNDQIARAQPDQRSSHPRASTTPDKGSSHLRTSTTPNDDAPDTDLESETDSEPNFLAKSERGLEDSPRRTNKRLDHIRELELEAESKISQRAERANRPRAKSNTKLEQVRDREADSLSRKSIASVRLDEIRERNSSSPSTSPKASQQQQTRQGVMQEPTPDPTEGQRSESPSEARGIPVPDIPVTVYKANPVAPAPAANSNEKAKESPDLVVQSRPSNRSRRDSRDLLRRLSRVASNSPQAITDEKKVDGEIDSTSAPAVASTTKPLPAADEHGKEETHNAATKKNKSTDAKPSVDFVVGPSRNRSSSSNSIPSKRSSRSDIDPVHRIEAEMDLFAPQDNQSEKGSMRAPSPEPSDEEVFESVEETPRALKLDPLTQPTPRVIGAYVDTPVTIKVEKMAKLDVVEPTFPPETNMEEPPSPIVKLSSKRESTSAAFATEITNKSYTRTHGKHNSTSGASPRKVAESPTKRNSRVIHMSDGPITVRRRRVRSESRQPLVNTARIPSVRDDLLEIQRQANIEDSTLDNFDELIKCHEAAERHQLSSSNRSDRDDSDDSNDVDEDPEDGKGEEMAQPMVTDNKMERRLSMALAEIRSARAWANKFEDKLNKQIGHTSYESTSEQAGEAAAKANGTGGLAKLRWILILLASWLVLEASVCRMFCKPSACGPGVPCEWSPSDPIAFGTALPVKLDHWVMGGKGGEILGRAAETAGDWFVDVYCTHVGGGVGTGPGGCRFGGGVREKRRVQRILSKKDGTVGGMYDEVTPGMYSWLQAKRAEMGRGGVAEEAEEEIGEDVDQEEGEDIGFISGDERF